ncbi:MAG: DUF2270 domain-containing protein [Kiloniellaceae bacterium]
MPLEELPEQPRNFSTADIGALAHLYRAEVYRSTIWRTRLDNTTNWSVVTLGIALSITFSSTAASPVPLVLVGILVTLFLTLEARRYRYFNVWRARARWMETHFYAPMLREGDLHTEEHWQDTLADDYMRPRYHITFMRAMGRRLRRNYVWILLIQTVAYSGKIVIHPTPVASFAELVERAAIGPVPGEFMLICGLLYNAAWIGTALVTLRIDQASHRNAQSEAAMG